MVSWPLAIVLACASGLALCDDEDALNLQAAPEAAATSTSSPTRTFVEGALAHTQQRYGLPAVNGYRLSVDLTYAASLGAGWRLGFSDRFDHVHRVDGDDSMNRNSLREAFAGWQDDKGDWTVDFGRINVRNGPGYGYNPTDYFRDHALRSFTSADPIALRDNRLGTVMLRAQRLWSGGSIALALAPKLADAPSDSSLSLDLGATNSTNKALLTLNAKASERVSGQVLLFSRQGRSPQWGFNGTALVSDAIVAHVEYSRGRDTVLLSEMAGSPEPARMRARAVAGMTVSSGTGLSVTGEYEYNGAGAGRSTWDQAALAGSSVLGAYMLEAQARQESASRGAWLVYASQKDFLTKSLDLTGFVRVNANDHSQLGWVQLRRHWERMDAAVQWQWTRGDALSEYGVLPFRQSLQLLGAWYF